MNSPLSNIDPSGLVLCDYGDDGEGGEAYEDEDTENYCTDHGGSVVDAVQDVTVNGNTGNANFGELYYIELPDPGGDWGGWGNGGAGGNGGGDGSGDSGPSYTHEDVCGASALLNKGLPTFLDALGLIPGEGTVATGVQFGAGILSALMSDSQTGVGLSAGGLGLTTLDSGLKSQGRKVAVQLFGKSVKIIPVVGIAVSAVSTYQDVYGKDGMNAYYDNCMAGKN